jgi:hypothetical protein
MKLGAALTLRADLSRELGPLRNAVREYARYSVLAKTGKAVNLQEDPETLLQTYLAKNNQLDEGKKRANDAARRYRELDLQIQEANWATDLIER